jgi:rod shape-determining protein MreD
MNAPRVRTLEVIGKFTISLVVVVVIQGILAAKFHVVRYFDLPLLCTVYYGFTLGNPIASIVMGSTLGLMQDSLSAAALGTNGFSKTLIGFLAASAGSKFAVDQPITRIFALFLFTIADSLLVTMLSQMVGPASNATYSGALGGWLLSATFNTLLGLILLGYHDRKMNHATT